ncbi:MAG: DUF2232 domain-containing protein [Gammaproteobacteria bacterium]|nr:DUF2232 domain-containing protein [Gammaproteobacteria bacterium]
MAATTAMLGVLFAPAIWLSAAAIALVALVKKGRQALIVTAIAAVGTMLFAGLIFASPSMSLYFVLAAWLPVLIAAQLLRHVSLEASLQAMAGLALVVITGLYSFFPEMGEIWREPLDVMVQQLLESSPEQFDIESLREIQEWVIRMMPGFLVSSVFLGTLISLFLARWWQSAIVNPGGFGREFQALLLGKISAMIALAIITAALLAGSALWYAMLLIVLLLYTTQGMSILHAVFKGRQLNKIWLYLIYLAMFLLPEVVAMLILLGIADAWVDFRRRLITV